MAQGVADRRPVPLSTLLYSYTLFLIFHSKKSSSWVFLDLQLLGLVVPIDGRLRKDDASTIFPDYLQVQKGNPKFSIGCALHD